MDGSHDDDLREENIADRDELWSSLHALRSEIDQLADGEFSASDRELQIIAIIARVVAAELDFRKRVRKSMT